MHLNIEELTHELSSTQQSKLRLEEELHSAFNQEHHANVAFQINTIKTKEAKLLARIAFLTAPATATSLDELSTYNDLIYKRLTEIYNSFQDIEQQRSLGHNEQHGLKMDAEEEKLCKEESNLAAQIHRISSNKAHNLTHVDTKTANTCVRTLSIARGDAGLFELECMQQANAMLLLLLHSYEVGELSLSQYIAKQTAVNSKLQFFSSQTIKDFSDNLTAAVLDEPEDDEPFFHF